MITVRMLYFAALRDLLGTPEEQLELPASVMKVADLVPFLESARPHLRGRFASVRVAVNESFASAEDPLSDGDVIALIPPVAGG